MPGADLSVTFVGQFIARALGLLTFLVMTRTLNPAEYGVFMLAQSVFHIMLRLSEMGLDTGMTRLLSKAIRDGDERAQGAALKGAFVAKLGVGLAVFALAYATAPFVAGEILRQPQMVPYLRIAYLGIVGMQLQGFYLAGFGARLEFKRAAVLAVLTPLLIVLAVIVAWWRRGLEVSLCLEIYAIAPLCACGFGVATLSHRFLRRRYATAESIGPLWRFSRWVYGSNVLGTFRFRLNSILLSRFATMDDVGLYNYGDKLASVLSLFSSTILMVFIPRTARLTSREELKRLLRRNYRWFLVLVPTLIVLPVASRPVIGILSPHYVAAAPIFAVLFFSVLFSLLALPSRAVLYSVDRPQAETAIEGIALALALVAGYTLVQLFGGLGAALAMLLQRIASAGLTLAVAYRAVDGSAPSAPAASRAGSAGEP